MNIKKLLGEQIKHFRKNRNLTQEQFAEMIDIAPRNLSRIEVGESFVTADTLDRIINALGVSAEQLFAYEQAKDTKELLADIYTYLDSIKSNRKKLKKIYQLISYVRENEI